MSGLTGNNILAGSSGQGAYEIEQSLRLDNGDYLNRTPGSASNRKTWTLSFWAKRSISTVDYQNVIMAGTAGVSSDRTYVRFNETADDSVLKIHNVGSFELWTSAVFRDPSAWYHVVAAVDTTEATASDRVKLWVNGVLQTLTGTTASLNDDTRINNTVPHYIGRSTYITGRHFDGYLAEFHLIDGQALTPSDFAETNLLTNQWIPKKYVGTYGTNGFYLNFGNSASLGADSSGNGNDFTPTNLAATDQVLDSPTNNFATLNPLAPRLSSGTAYGDLSEGNLKFTNASGTVSGPRKSTYALGDNTKIYCEFVLNVVGSVDRWVGLIPQSTRFDTIGGPAYAAVGSYAYQLDNGVTRIAGVIDQTGLPTAVAGDIIQIAYDPSNGKMWFGKNNTWLLSGDPANGTNPTITASPVGELVPLCGGYAGDAWTANFGQDSSFAGAKTAQGNKDANGKGDFYYAPPAGYLALCHDNLPTPEIALPGDYFNTVLYTGAGGTYSLTGVGFQPDFIWIKIRSGVDRHHIVDSVRGASKNLSSHTTAAESTNAPDGYLSSIDSDGWTGPGDKPATTSNNVNFASWNWKAGGTASSNTDGTITSTVSANPTAGFSIVKYTGNATAGATVGHGLSQAPEFVIVKQLDAVKNWSIYANDPTDYLTFTANASADDDRFWNDTSPGASVFTLGGIDWVNASGNDYISYCFHSVEGYSKFGSYTGNGSADGTFVYTGFKPTWVLVKSLGVEDWFMYDGKRDPINVADKRLKANATSTEATVVGVDFLSNGFKWRGTTAAFNQSGVTFIYMAFAESPFKYSNAR